MKSNTFLMSATALPWADAAAFSSAISSGVGGFCSRVYYHFTNSVYYHFTDSVYYHFTNSVYYHFTILLSGYYEFTEFYYQFTMSVYYQFTVSLLIFNINLLWAFTMSFTDFTMCWMCVYYVYYSLHGGFL